MFTISRGRIAVSCVLTVLGLTLGAGGGQPSGTNSPPATQTTQPARERASAVADADVAQLVDGGTAFALDLYRVLRQGQQEKKETTHLFFSPYSVLTALTMTKAGARGETEAQMSQVLHVGPLGDRLYVTANALDLRLTVARQKAAEKKATLRLEIANRLWGQTGKPFLPAFLDLLARDYGAELGLLDFARDAEAARRTINDWVAAQTEQKIKDLLPGGSITPATALVLTNAIYFKGDWLAPFRKDWTYDGEFHLLSGQTVTVPLMKKEDALRYAAESGFHAVEMVYAGEVLAMDVIVPDAGHFAEFERDWDVKRLKSVLASLKSRPMTLTMPKFTCISECPLKSVLSSLGMSIAFTGQADFSGMDGSRDLFIDEVYHKAFVAVDETGTEAAAATGVPMRETALPPKRFELTIDRPFIFLIRDLPTGAVLFMGYIGDPRGQG